MIDKEQEQIKVWDTTFIPLSERESKDEQLSCARLYVPKHEITPWELKFDCLAIARLSAGKTTFSKYINRRCSLSVQMKV